MTNIIRKLFALCLNTRGNVAMIFALSIVPIIAVAGTAIDLNRISNAKLQMQMALDNGVLAAANLQYEEDPEAVVIGWVKGQMGALGYDPSEVTVEVVFDKNLNSKEVIGTASMPLPTVLMSIVGKDKVTLNVTSIAYQSIPNLEIAMVLDISSSMNGSRLTSLKSASTLFVDIMLNDDTKDSTSISVVPFGGTVNVGKDLFDDFAVPLPSSPGSKTILNPDDSEYEKVEDNDFLFSDGDYCLEATQDDFDFELLPAFGRSQVPHFWRWWNFHAWCPHEDSAVFMNSNNQTDLQSHLNGMVLSDGTGMDIGILWGLKALSPNFRGLLGGDFSERPLDMGSDDSRKVMIVMTDGAITAQDRPEDYTLFNTHTNRSSNNDPDGSGKSNQGNNKNKWVSLSKGSSSHTSSNDNAVGRFKLACEEAKAENILVFTIGFQIKSGSLPDSLLNECASSAEYYYHVESLDLDATFTSIATQVNELRITE